MTPWTRPTWRRYRASKAATSPAPADCASARSASSAGGLGASVGLALGIRSVTVAVSIPSPMRYQGPGFKPLLDEAGAAPGRSRPGPLDSHGCCKAASRVERGEERVLTPAAADRLRTAQLPEIGWRICHARERDKAPRRQGQTRGQVAEHPGRRVRSRGNRAHPRRQAWRALGQAGHCDRLVEGTPGWRRRAAAEEGQGQQGDARKGQARQRSRRPEKARLQDAFARGQQGAQARRFRSRNEDRAVEAGACSGKETTGFRTIGGGEKGGQDQGRERSLGRCKEGRAHPPGSHALTRLPMPWIDRLPIPRKT